MILFSAVKQFWWLLLLFLSIFGLFFSLWIVVPAPNFWLLTLSICATELSPWLILINAIALASGIFMRKGWPAYSILLGSTLALTLSLLPLLQLSAANQIFSLEMERVLGVDYLNRIPSELLSKMRQQPLAIADIFRGISVPQVRSDRGIIFASPDGVDLQLNLYRPLKTGKYPALVVIYGGAWRSGSPDDYEKFSSYIAAQGYSVINIDYRHAPQYKFPAQLEDVEAALKYICHNAENFEIDPNNMAIMGRSAGGHLATITAYQQNALPFKAVISYYSPVNLTEGYENPPVPNPINTREVLKNFLGGTPEQFPELYHQASPINYPRPNLPHSLLVYGRNDHLVKVEFGKQMYAKLQATNNPVIWLEIPWAEHAFDAVFFGVSNQLALYYTERFLAVNLKEK